MHPEKLESEWFRPPQVIQMCPMGDTKRFLLVAEVEHGYISAVTYAVTGTLLVAVDPSFMSKMHQAAHKELLRRIEADEFYPVGSHYDDIRLWIHDIWRNEDGTYEVRDATASEGKADEVEPGSRT